MIEHILTVFSSGHMAMMALAMMALALVVAFELEYWLDLGERQHQIVRNLTLVAFGIFSIAFHHYMNDHPVFIDIRGVGIAIATLFGGIALGTLTLLAGIAAHAWVGGTALLADSLGLCLDLILMVLVLRWGMSASILRIVLAGCAVGIGEATALLFIAPVELGLSLFQDYSLSLFFIQILGTFLFGWLLKLQDERIRGRAHGRTRIQNLNEALKRGVAALSTAMVHHDPSTAGHEQRVADLCVKVGQSLGMDADRLEGLQLAAMVHDVGQIRVPREILSRPRRLSPEEFELVKLHVEAGYQILKDVPFPWPIANIVRQHHEHMDGSGYPSGLRGEQMLPEARILHVCDAMEAMTSHRPFRRAYPIERALDELQAYKATRYDPAVVDVVVRLFSREGYQFPDHKTEVAL